MGAALVQPSPAQEPPMQQQQQQKKRPEGSNALAYQIKKARLAKASQDCQDSAAHPHIAPHLQLQAEMALVTDPYSVPPYPVRRLVGKSLRSNLNHRRTFKATVLNALGSIKEAIAKYPLDVAARGAQI